MRTDKVPEGGCPNRAGRGEGSCPAGGFCWRYPICKSEGEAKLNPSFAPPAQFDGAWSR
jgi:hypothetical protein